MNEELRKKIPKEITINGVKGKLHRARTYYEEGGFATYLDYRFKTVELNKKLLGEKSGKNRR